MACASGASEEEGLGGREEKRAASKAHATLKESLLSKAQGGASSVLRFDMGRHGVG